MTGLTLYDLLEPQFLSGVAFPEHIDAYLSQLRVETLHTAYDDAALVYSGRLAFGAEFEGLPPIVQHFDPDGSAWTFELLAVDFRLTLPRDGNSLIDTVAQLPDPTDPNDLLLPDLAALLADLGPVEQAAAVPTEYPGTRFRLELLLNSAAFDLGDAWLPGRLAGNRRIEIDPQAERAQVRIILPKMLFEYTQGEDLSQPPQFRQRAWGNIGFDAPSDLDSGELVRMEPPIALHASGALAFSLNQIQVDTSSDHTPPEIMEHFGVDEAWTGIFVKNARLYFNNDNLNFGFNLAVNDLLISPQTGVSFEAALDVFMALDLTLFSVNLRFMNNGVDLSERLIPAADGGTITLPQTAVAQVLINGGVPEYTIAATIGGEELWNNQRRQILLSPQMFAGGALRPVGDYTLTVKVTDTATPAPREVTLTYNIKLVAAETQLPPDQQDGSPLDRQPDETVQPAEFTIVSPAATDIPPTARLIHRAAGGLTEVITIGARRPTTVSARRNGTTVAAPQLRDERYYLVDVDHGEQLELTFSYAEIVGQPETVTERLYFMLERPRTSAEASSYASGALAAPDPWFSGAAPEPDAQTGLSGAQGLSDWLDTFQPARVELRGYASFEYDRNFESDLELSRRRFDVANTIVTAKGITVSNTRADGGKGHVDAKNDPRPGSGIHRRVEIIATRNSSVTTPALTVVVRLSRPPQPFLPAPDQPPVAVVKESAESPSFPDVIPPVLRRLGLRVKVERSVLALLELSGQLDFETEFERYLRQENEIPAGAELPPCAGIPDTPAPDPANPNQPPANPNPNDGLIDFAAIFVYDQATRALTITLALGAAEGDRDGLCQFDNPREPDADRTAENIIGDALGVTVLLAPLLNVAADSFDPQSAGDWVIVGGSLGAATALVAADILRTEAITLYGGKFKARQYLPPFDTFPPADPYRFLGFGFLFDYAVAFRIMIEQLGISAKVPLRVRYKAAGFFLHTDIAVGSDAGLIDIQEPFRYQPIFDTSKGYEVELTDPAVFELPEPLGEILQIFAVRMARINPLTLELDIALKVDLGAAVGGRFLVTAALDGSVPPTIMPSLLFIKIPGTLEATGYINIVNTVDPNTGVTQKGLEGMLDLSLPSVGLRVTASVGVVLIGPGAADLQQLAPFVAAAVFVGIAVAFPTPIPLWSSGIAIYGFSGLFAMHYNRVENAQDARLSVGPALGWLVRSGGNPTRLVDGAGEKLWDVQLGQWSVGIGIVLGTTVNNILINFGGMLVLELPGPRILIFVKVQVLTVLPSLDDAQLAVGVLGVIDLDFNLGQLTIGVMISFTIEQLIRVQVPVEIFFKFHDLPDWHLYAGTIADPATADILGIVRGRGYLMIAGKGIAPFPPPDGAGLEGVAVAVGLEAALRFGEGGIYAEVAAGAHLGAAFAPLFLVGKIYLRGAIHIFIASIGAHAELTVEAPDPVYVHGSICGKIDLWLTALEACIPIAFGSDQRTLTPPDLVRGVFLQSRAPVLSHGQASERPIDASLGNAARDPGGERPVVPIDALPVLQFFGPPRFASGFSSFSAPLLPPPNTADPDGWIPVGGGRRVRYHLAALELDPPLPAGTPQPPATWRVEGAPAERGGATNLDLALFTRVPFVAERAIERSAGLDELVRTRWAQSCAEPAPPTCVLYTFCGQPFGPSAAGWTLNGTALPDPPGTTRRSPPPLSLPVTPPAQSEQDQLLDRLLAAAGEQSTVPAQVVGRTRWAGTAATREMICSAFDRLRPGNRTNPTTLSGLKLLALDRAGRPAGQIAVAALGRNVGIQIAAGLQIELPATTGLVELTLVAAAPVAIIARDARRRIVDQARMARRGMQPQQVTLTGRGISVLELRAEAERTVLVQVCRERVTPGTPGVVPEDAACYRALQLPFAMQLDQRELTLPDSVRKAAQERAARQQVTLQTGRSSTVTLYLALRKDGERRVTLRELDAKGDAIRSRLLSDLNPVRVERLADLPADWQAADLPWREQVAPLVALFAEPRYSEFHGVVATLTPLTQTEQLRIEVVSAGLNEPQALLGVVALCPLAEQQRVETEQELRQAEIATLEGFLSSNDVVPLLTPDTDYKLALRYRIESADAEGATSEVTRQQSFHFRTDAAPPPRLDPYVLGTTPHHEARLHFAEDACRLILNDATIELLYARYGKSLRAVVRTADGAAVAANEPDLAASRVLRIPLAARLHAVPATQLTPLRATLGRFVRDTLDCVNGTDGASHAVSDLPLLLRPLMAYTVDIEADPVVPPPPGEPVQPLFRFQFTTSRYPNIAAFATAFRATRMHMFALQAPLAGLPAPAAGATVVEVSNLALQDALRAAGEEQLDAAESPQIRLYWAPAAGGIFRPHALLLDAQEPLWRTRPAPRLEPVPRPPGAPTDPSYQRIVTAQVPALELVATQTGTVSHFVRTQSGTRTLVMLTPLAEPAPPTLQIGLALQRAADELFGISAVTESILDVTVDPRPPWEDADG